MKIEGRPLFWLIAVILVLMVWRAPSAMSAALGGIGNLFVSIADGFGAFIRALAS